MLEMLLLIVVLFLTVIILVILHMPVKKTTKLDYLFRLSRYWGGRLEKLEDRGDSYSIAFEVDGVSFAFEDVEERGINKIIDNIYLKMKVDLKMNLIFMEKKQRASIRTELVFASQIPDNVVSMDDQITLPKSLEMFEIYTNQPFVANKIFKHPQVASLLTEIKNMDQRGYPFVPFRILDGVVYLSFYKNALFRPNIVEFGKDPASLESYIDKLLVIHEIVKNQ